MFDKENELEFPLPNFVSIRQDSLYEQAFLAVETTVKADVGSYQIRVYSQLQNFYRNTTFISFNLVVFENSELDWSLLPFFSANLVDQEVSLGNSLTYRPDIKIEPNGWDMQLHTDLGRANKFTRFDAELLEFTCYAQMLDETDLGLHEIQIKVVFTSPLREVIFEKRTFQINVVNATDSNDDGDKQPSETDLLPKWSDPIYSDLLPEIDVADPAKRPVPYIARLSDTGLLAIGWDRRMQPPQAYRNIPLTKVAISDYSIFTPFEVENRLEFKWFSVLDENAEL